MQAALTGVAAGVLIRYSMLKRDYRQYPVIPWHGNTSCRPSLPQSLARSNPGANRKRIYCCNSWPCGSTIQTCDLERMMLKNLDEIILFQGAEYVEGGQVLSPKLPGHVYIFIGRRSYLHRKYFVVDSCSSYLLYFGRLKEEKLLVK